MIFVTTTYHFTLTTLLGTNTGTGIIKGQELIANHGRPGVPHVMVVLSDGNHNKGPEPGTESQKARNSGTKTIAVGIGNRINGDEILAIAGDNTNVLAAKDFDELQQFVEKLAVKICGMYAIFPISCLLI